MQSKSYDLLVTAAGQLMQQHAFDHLTDEKLARMNACLCRLGRQEIRLDMKSAEAELLEICSEANLYIETTTTQSLHQWYAAMSCFGMGLQTMIEEEEQS